MSDRGKASSDFGETIFRQVGHHFRSEVSFGHSRLFCRRLGVLDDPPVGIEHRLVSQIGAAVRALFQVVMNRTVRYQMRLGAVARTRAAATEFALASAGRRFRTAVLIPFRLFTGGPVYRFVGVLFSHPSQFSAERRHLPGQFLGHGLRVVRQV